MERILVIRQRFFEAQALACTFMVLGLAGCGGGLERLPTASVTGTITCNGKPVDSIIVLFEPLGNGEAGKQGYAVADANGNFTVSTYGNNDGAVVGKHRVRVMPPDKQGWSCDCGTNSEVDVAQIDVVSGDNNFQLELPAKKKRSDQSMGSDWDEND